MQAKTIKARSAAELSSLLTESLNGNYTPTLAIVFLPNAYDFEPYSALFGEKGISVFGVSSYGQFIDADHDTDSVVAMLMDIRPDDFRIECRETGNISTRDMARSIGNAGKLAFNKPAFILATGGIKTNGEMVIEGIEETAGKESKIFGGLGASDFQTMKTFVFTNGKITYDGLVALILDEERIKITSFATGGCHPVGIFHSITRSEGNIVYTIDDQPALDLVLRYCGKQQDALNNHVDVFNTISRHFQIQLFRENASYVMRTVMYVNPEDRSVVFAGSLLQGAKVKFSILPGFEVVDNVVNELTAFSKNTPDAEAMILFSCKGREIAFGPWMNEEIDRLHKIWNAPMIGLFSFGEIGNGGDGKNEFYNMTCSLAILKENN